MDGERNIVQTVLKANNTFKDFSPHLSLSVFRSLFTHKHRPFSCSGNEALSWTTAGT